MEVAMGNQRIQIITGSRFCQGIKYKHIYRSITKNWLAFKCKFFKFLLQKNMEDWTWKVVYIPSTYTLLLKLSYMAHLTAKVYRKRHLAVCSGRKGNQVCWTANRLYYTNHWKRYSSKLSLNISLEAANNNCNVTVI